MSWLVDIIMPVYNAAPYLKESIDSILSQDFSDFWFIIIDDWSTDWSVDILKQYAEKDSRIKLLFNKKNSWICISLNKAISHSNAKYILRMDADDISYQNRIRLQINFMENNPTVWVCGCNVRCIWNKNKTSFVKKYPETDSEIRNSLFLFNPISHPWSIIRKDIFSMTEGYNNNFILAEDLHLWFSLWQYAKFANMPMVLLDYREYTNNSTYGKLKNMIQQSIKTRLYAIKKYWYRAWIKWWLAITISFVIQYLPIAIIHPLFYRLRSITQ